MFRYLPGLCALSLGQLCVNPTTLSQESAFYIVSRKFFEIPDFILTSNLYICLCTHGFTSNNGNTHTHTHTHCPDFLLEALLGNVPQNVGVQRAQVGSSDGVELSAAQFVPFLTQIFRDDGLRLDEKTQVTHLLQCTDTQYTLLIY